jgi:acetyl esterase/lipase
MKRKIVFFLLVVFCYVTGYAQKIIPIWMGPVPGSENWTWQQAIDSSEWINDPLAYNVTIPTLTFFPADPASANGTAVIICPGGSFYYLHIKTEGSDAAKWLNRKGVSAFVLQYRVVHSETSHPVKEKNEKLKDRENMARLITALAPLAIADARQALAYTRKHAAEFGIVPDKIGIMGFSAGGALAVSSTFDCTEENRPDFLAAIYAYVPPTLGMKVSEHTAPIFITAASDDELHLVPMSINLYNNWLAAGRSAELHIYSKGGHGFGMNRKDLPSDSWIERFGDWLQQEGWLKKQ